MFHILNKLFPKKELEIDLLEIKKLPIPEHIAIIMDGNGRWASTKGLPRAAGHKAGTENLRKIVETCIDLGVKYLTVYAFSTENWKRPKEEVDILMDLLVEYIEKELDILNQNGVKIKAIGNLSWLPKKAESMMKKAENKTMENKKLSLQIALNYGGRKEILDAVISIADKVKSGELQIDNIDEKTFANQLYTKDIPDPDLMIRTAGEKRISNFLLWQCAYTEFWFTSVFWPNFSPQYLYRAIYEFQRRQRRYGGLK